MTWNVCLVFFSFCSTGKQSCSLSPEAWSDINSEQITSQMETSRHVQRRQSVHTQLLFKDIMRKPRWTTLLVPTSAWTPSVFSTAMALPSLEKWVLSCLEAAKFYLTSEVTTWPSGLGNISRWHLPITPGNFYHVLWRTGVIFMLICTGSLANLSRENTVCIWGHAVSSL